MAKKQSEDVIQRAYLLRYLARLAKDGTTGRTTSEGLLSLIRSWVRGQAKRASKPGGIGRR